MGVPARLLRDRAAVVGLLLVALAVCAAAGAPVLALHDPAAVNPACAL